MNQRSETYELLLRKSYERIEELEAQVAALRRDAQEPIAIIGLGCRFPGADNPQAFWNLLRAGRDAIQEVPEDRWDIDAIYNPDPNAEGSICTRFGGFINHVSEFDPQFFDITPREAYSLDPQQRLLLETSWETLEHAGLTPPNLPARTGVFVGISNVDHREALIRCEPANINGYFASGNTASMASGRLAYFLGINGPCLSIDTACSSSLVAVHVAVLSLRHRDCELALAGGVNCILTPHESISLSRSGMLSPKGRCQAFDAAADGYVRGEGCGMILLKRLSDALAEGDNVLAIIRGSAMNQDGRTSGLTVPNGLSQQAVIREALADGMVAPEEVDYLEAHGTGTSLGDPIEVGALGAVFGRRQNPLWVGSVKTNIGHLEAAAGIASLIKVVLALQAGEIPPQLHFQHPSPLISWEQWPIRIVNENVPWPQNRRIAGISSFSFSGTNCHLIVGEAPAKNSGASSVDRGHYVLALSAKTPQALHQLAGRYLDYLHSAHGVSLADICFSANTGRSHFRHRFAAVGASGADLCAQFESFRRRDQSDNSDSPPKVAFLFTGQGVQEDGMGRELFATQPAFRVAMEQCAAIVDPWLEHPLIDVIYSGRLAGTMRQAVYAPPALFALEYALTQLWLSWGVKPEMLLGHSLGEYVAACVAGVFSLADGLRLAVERGRLTQALALPGTMIAVRATPAEVGPWLAQYPQTAIAAFNGPRSLVLSGPEENVRALAEELGGKGLVYRNLAVTHAFHSPLMESVQAAFAKLAIQIRYLPPKITLVSNLSGAVAGEELCNSSYWVHHLREPVRFAEGMETLRQEGANTFLEIGPRPALLPLGRKCLTGKEYTWLGSLAPGRTWPKMLASLAKLYMRGVTIDWRAFERDFASARKKVDLPTYPFQRQKYWMRPPEQSPLKPPTPTRDWRQELLEVCWQSQEHDTQSDQVAKAEPESWILISAPRKDEAPALAEKIAASSNHRIFCHHRVYGSDTTRQTFAIALAEAQTTAPLRGVIFWADSGQGLPPPEQATCVATQLLQLVQALAECHASARLWVLTQHAQAVEGDKYLEIALSSLWGFSRAIAAEYPEWKCTVIDFDFVHVTSLVQELLAPSPESQLILRQNRRYVARLVPVTRSLDPTIPIRPDSTYLVTGGLGGLGLQVARALAANGARHIVLAGRCTQLSAGVTETLRDIEQTGASVQVVQADISREDDVQALLDSCSSRGTLRGIIHAAGLLDNQAISRLTPERLLTVMAPKVAGAWFLHIFSAVLPLDFFVCFSSMASVLETRSAAAYAAANAFLDALVKQRQASGLPGLSIQWGPWADVGMSAGDAAQFHSMGVAMIPPRAGASLAIELATTSRSGAPLAVFSANWALLCSVLSAGQPPALLQTVLALGQTSPPHAQSSFWLSNSTAAAWPHGPKAFSEKRRLLVSHIQTLLVASLGLRGVPDLHLGFFDMGMDSIIALEFHGRLQSSLDCRFPFNLIFKYPQVETLADYLLQETLSEPRRTPHNEVAATGTSTASPEGAPLVSHEELLSRILGKVDTHE